MDYFLLARAFQVCQDRPRDSEVEREARPQLPSPFLEVPALTQRKASHQNSTCRVDRLVSYHEGQAHNSSNGLCSSGPEARPALPVNTHTHTQTHSGPCTWTPLRTPHRYQESHCQMHTLKMLKGCVFLFQGPIPNHKRPLSLSGAR